MEQKYKYIKEIKNCYYYSYSKFNLILKLIILVFYCISGNNYLRNLHMYNSRINLIIQGPGNINILNEDFYLAPDQVFVNGILQADSCNQNCFLKETENNVIIIFNEQIESCFQMFGGCDKIKELDLSELDNSKVTNMAYMFNSCTNLEKVYFGNINTSSVENMTSLFYNCNNLKYVDLINFDTSSVKYMDWMFSGCCSLQFLNISKFNTTEVESMNNMFENCIELIALNLSNFNTSKVTQMSHMFNGCRKLKFLDLSLFNISSVNSIDGMFSGCESLIYLNIKSFQINNSMSIEDSFIGLSPNLKYCTNDLNLSKLFLNENYINSNCSDICFQKNIKLDLNNSECINSCNDKGYNFEYSGICYNECPDGTIASNEDNNICIVNIIFNEIKSNITEGNYLDINDFDLNIKTNNTISPEDVDKKISSMKEMIKNGFLNNLIDNIINKGIDYNGSFWQIKYYLTSTGNQKKNRNKNISNIDLGDCEDILIAKYGLNKSHQLIIFKIEYKQNNTIPIIEYEIYHPINKSKLDLSYCNNTLTINISVSIDENKLYKYDPNSDYYQDECSSYTTDNGYDITLEDRKKEYIEQNLALCEYGCSYGGYDKEFKQSICKCNIKNKINSIDIIINNTHLLSNDFNLSESKNEEGLLDMFKCTKALFSLDGIIKNISSYIFISFFLFYIVSVIIYIKLGYPKLISKINNILNKKLNLLTQNKNNKSNTAGNKNNNKIKKKTKGKKTNKKKGNNFPPKKGKIKFSSTVNMDKNNNERSSNSKLNLGRSRQLMSLRFMENENNNKKKKKKEEENKKKSNKVSESYSKQNKNNITNTKTSKLKKNICKNLITQKNYNDYELNTMDYDKAKINDKRTCCQYYASLIKTKNLILFAFFPIRDHNSQIIKICLLILFFSINYVTNFILVYKNIVHEIYIKDGKYNIMNYILQMAISFGICHIIIIIFKIIFLSERCIAEIKKQITPYLTKTAAADAKNGLKIKYVLFFLLGLILFGSFWIILSSFGAVYKNTQFIIFENALVSFSVELIFPFFISLFPCLLRIPAINSKENSECIYNFSLILQFL